MCIPNTNNCIVKTIKIQELPGAISKVNIHTPSNIIPAGGQLPVIIQASDEGGNSIHQDAQNYTLSVNTGTLNGQKSIQINNFSDAIMYEAPIGIQDNIATSITFSGINQEGKVIHMQQNIIVAKALLQVTTNTKDNKTIQYQLPKDETILIKVDSNAIPQIQTNVLPKITIQLKDKNGNRLDSAIHVFSKNGLLTPGNIQTNAKSHQNTFQAQEDGVIINGEYTIYLYPNFKAGKDELHIQIPGLPETSIPIQINAAQAQKVYIQMSKENYAPQQQTQGKITVVDYWNNKVQEPTIIKIGAIGPGTINEQDSTELLWTGTDIVFNFQTKST
ncbi:MAG: hypothetical protein WCJ39_01010 [bacterium]